MRLSIFFISAVFLCGIAQAKAPLSKDTLVEKGYDECHHAVYGYAELITESGIPLPASQGMTVPLTLSGPSRGILFNPETSTFTIRHTGTYVINYFLRLWSNFYAGIVGYVTTAVYINGARKGPMYLQAHVIDRNQDSFIAEGSRTIYENLRKGDEVRIVIELINELGIPAFISNYDSASAYLAIHKAERND